MAWKVYLSNQHAQCWISADSKVSRRDAFNRAFRKAGMEFRHYKLADIFGSANGADVMWLAAFNDAQAHMRRGQTQSLTHSLPQGLNVEIRRV